MRDDDMEDRLRRLDEDQRSSWSRWITRIVALLLLGALGVGVHFWNQKEQKNIEKNGVPLPDVLIHKASPARRDLALLNRDLSELAKEVDKALSGHPGQKNRKKGDRFLTRLHDLHKLGSGLEPKLTREERRVLMATEHAEKQIEQFILSSYGEAFYDHRLIEVAQKQISRAQALARGEVADAIVGEGAMAKVGAVVGQLKGITDGLQQIQKLKDAQGGIPADVANVPEIDGPKKTPHKKKHKRKHHDDE